MNTYPNNTYTNTTGNMNPNYPHNTNTVVTHDAHGRPIVQTTTHQTYVVPPTTTHTVNVGNPAYTRGETHKWDNPYGLSIPLITFDPTCRKCHGSGVSKSRFSGTPLPCTRCYTRHGYCKKCYGTGVNYRKNKACNKCNAGKRLKGNMSSSSSDSN